MPGRPYSPTDLTHPLIKRLGQTVGYRGPRGGHYRAVLANVHEDGTATFTNRRTGIVVAVIPIGRVTA